MGNTLWGTTLGRGGGGGGGGGGENLNQTLALGNATGGLDIVVSAGDVVTLTNPPTADTDAANKLYVDQLAAGLDWQESVLERRTTPPGAPVLGARYLIIAVAAGAWVGREDDIAEWDGAAWNYTTPNLGFAVYVENENRAYVYNGAAWVYFASILDHNTLANIQGGIAAERYHLTSAQQSVLTGGAASDASAQHNHPLQSSYNVSPVSPGPHITLNGVQGSLALADGGLNLPIINLQPTLGNTRGDLAFGVARTADPGAPAEGDLWYESTLHRFRQNDGTDDLSLWPQPHNIVTVSPVGGDYATIGAAVAAITTASVVNPFLVMVEPGVYAEAPITMKSYVAVRGRDRSTVAITATNPNSPLFTMAQYSSVREVHIVAGPANDDAFYSATGTGRVFVGSVLITAGLNGFHVDGAGTVAMLEDCFMLGGLTGAGILATSAATAACDLSFIGATTGVYANGGMVKINTLNVQGCTMGVLANNGGNIKLSNITMESCTTCVATGATGVNTITGDGLGIAGATVTELSQGAASGVFDISSGSMDETKISVIDYSNVNIGYNDSGDHTYKVTGSFEVGQFEGFPVLRVQNTANPIRVMPETRTFTSTPGSFIYFDAAIVQTHDYPNVTFGGINLAGTVEHKQAGFVWNHMLLFNNGLTLKNVSGVAANFGPVNSYIAQHKMQADAAAISMTTNRDFISVPKFTALGGGTLAVTNQYGFQSGGSVETGATLVNRFGLHISDFVTTGVMTNETGILIDDLSSGASSIIGIDSDMTGTGKTFINHPGTSPSNFGGEIFMSNGIPLTLGTAGGSRVSLSRSAAGVMRMIGVGGTFNEGLDWDFDTATANVVEVSSSTGANLQINTSKFTLGATAPASTSDWFASISPGARATNSIGDWADVQVAPAGAVTAGHAITDLSTVRISEPNITIGAGSVQNAASLIVTDAPTEGAAANYALWVQSGATELQATTVNGKLTVTGLIDPTGLVVVEQTTVPGGAPAAGDGTIWARDDTPNRAIFTDDAGTDNVLAYVSELGGAGLWSNTGTVIHPATATDEVGVGAAGANGTWFDDGDMVLGGAAMSGVEKLRVIGDERLEGGLLQTEAAAVPLAPAAAEGTWWIKNDAPNRAYFTDDAGTDHQLVYSTEVAAGYWERTGTILSPDTDGDTIEAGSGTIAQPSYAFESDPDTGFYLQAVANIGVVIGGTEQYRIADASIASSTTDAFHLRRAAGATGTPTYSFVGDTNTGMYSSGADIIEFAVGGGKVVEIDAAGLDVTGKLTVSGMIDPTGLMTTEQAAVPQAPGAGEGTWWAKNDAPNRPYFTDDAGTDNKLAYFSEIGGTSYWERTGTILSPDTDGDTVETGAGTVGQPGYAFEGDPDTGLYLQAVANIGVVIGGTEQYRIADASIASSTTDAFHLRRAAGATGTPTYSFVGDTNTGMYSSGADIIEFAVGGGKVVEIDAAGLDVTGKLTVSGMIDPTGLMTTEQAAVPQAPGAGEGTWWAKNDAPNRAYFTDDAGTDNQLAYSSEITSGAALPGITNVLFVDKSSIAGSEDGSMTNPFHSIDDAYNAAAALSPTAWDPIVIYVYPGYYDEQLVIDTDHVWIMGMTVGGNCMDAPNYSTQGVHGVIIANDSSPVVALTASECGMENILVTSETGSVRVMTCSSVGKVSFKNCEFSSRANTATWGVELTDDGGEYDFTDCNFLGYQGDGVDALAAFAGTAQFKRCAFYCDVDIDGMNTAANAKMIFENCFFGSSEELDRNSGSIKIGDTGCDVLIKNCIWTSGGDGNGCVEITRDCTVTIENCHMRSGPSGVTCSVYLISAVSLIVTGCVMEQRSSTVADIYVGGGAPTDVVVSNCWMTNGINGSCKTQNPIKKVGGHIDQYQSIIHAFTACGGEDKPVVQLQEDTTITATLAPPSEDITVDGQGFTLTRAAGSPIITVGASDTVRFRDITLVGSLDVNGNGAGLELQAGTVLVGRVDVISGDASTKVVMNGAHITGDATDLYALRIDDADPEILIFNSYLKGDTGDPAVKWTLDNSKLKASGSTFIHGDAAANDPFEVTGAETPTTTIDHCRFTVEPDPAVFLNAIAAGQQHNTFDVNADFDWAL